MKQQYQALIVDLSFQYVRFGLIAGDIFGDAVAYHREYSSQEVSNFESGLRTYMDEINLEIPPDFLVMSHAGPREENLVNFVHRQWLIDLDEICKKFQFKSWFARNSSMATAFSLPFLKSKDVLTETGQDFVFPVGNEGRYTLVSVNGGIGLAQLVISEDGSCRVYAAEGAHAGYAPRTDIEMVLFKELRKDHTFVSNEMLMSCRGLEKVYGILAELEEAKSLDLNYREIIMYAQSDADKYATQALEIVMGMIGAFAGDVALYSGANDGIFIAGDMAFTIGTDWQFDKVRAAVEAKGKMSGYVSDVPINLITNPNTPFFGVVKAFLEQQARSDAPSELAKTVA